MQSDVVRVYIKYTAVYGFTVRSYCMLYVLALTVHLHCMLYDLGLNVCTYCMLSWHLKIALASYPSYLCCTRGMG